MDNGKSALYLGGGGMAGVFGAGIVTKLQEAEAYDQINSIYAGSAGVFNGAYFLTRQTELGSSIYWEDLPGRLIQPTRLFSDGNVMDVDYLMNSIINSKPLDIEALKFSEIPFFGKVFNVQTRQIEWLDVRENPEYALRASVSAVPYYHPNGQKHIDADILDPVSLDDVLENDGRIVLALNNRPNPSFGHEIANWFNGVIGFFTHRDLNLYALFKQKSKKFRSGIERAQKEERVLLVHPPVDSPTRASTMNSKKIKTTWEMGKREAEKVLKFIE